MTNGIIGRWLGGRTFHDHVVAGIIFLENIGARCGSLNVFRGLDPLPSTVWL